MMQKKQLHLIANGYYDNELFSGHDIDRVVCDIAEGARFHPFYDCCEAGGIPKFIPKQYPKDIFSPLRFGKGVRL
jgi:hypothetical protein